MDNYIETRPEKCDGKPCIVGTRIRVWDIHLAHDRLGKSPDEIIEDYPELTLAAVHAALAFYWDHKAEIDKQMKEADDLVEQIKAASGPGPLVRKLTGMDASSGDKVSS